jgi:hypothetical protein
MYQTFLANSKNQDYDRQRIQQDKKSSSRCHYPLGENRLGYYDMRDAVNNYLEASGANRPSIGGEETILARRKIAANRLAIDCIYALSKEELSKVDSKLEKIVNDVPRQGYRLGR